METPQPVQSSMATPHLANGIDRQEVEIDVSSPNRDELLEIMSGLMIDYNAMTKCVEETTEALASAEDQANTAQQQLDALKDEGELLHKELQEVKQQLSERDSELEDCKIKLKWAQAPRSGEEKSGFVTLNAMNEQMQMAAIQTQREKQQRENLQKENRKLEDALEEAKQQNKDLQGRLTQRTQQCLVQEQQKREIQDARSRFAAKKHRARYDKTRGTAQQTPTLKGTPGQEPVATVPANTQGRDTDACKHMMPPTANNEGATGAAPLHPVVSDCSVPGNSASGCVSLTTPGSTAASRMLSPFSGGAVNSSNFRPSPSERAKAVLAQASRQEHTSPAQIHPPSNNTSLTEQPSLMPMASLLESASLAPQASAEEVRHAPNSVMCSQVWTSLAANFTDHSKPPAFGAKKSFGRSAKASPEKNQCQAVPERDLESRRASAPNALALAESLAQPQGKRPNSDHPARKLLPKRQPWPLKKWSAERHIFRHHEGYESSNDGWDEVRRSVSCSPQPAKQFSSAGNHAVDSVQERCSVVITAESGSTSPELGTSSMVLASAEGAPEQRNSNGLPASESERHSQQGLKEGLCSLQQDMTVFSQTCTLETSSQNENADVDCQEALRSSSELKQATARAPLKESSDNFEFPPRLQKARSRTNSAIVEAAFEPSAPRLNTAGSLHSRTISGKLSPKRRQGSHRPATAEARACARDSKWTPRSTITPSPGKAARPAAQGGKGGSGQKRSEWKVPNPRRSVLTNARTLPLQSKPSGDFSINAASGGQ